MNEAVIRKIIEESTTKLLEEICKSKEELRNELHSCEARLCLKIEEDSHKIKQLEQENCKLKNKIESLERNQRDKNFIIFGLNKRQAEINSEYIISEIKRLLDVEVHETQISNFYTLGKSDSAPLKIELNSFLKKKEIFANKNKLKGSKVTIVDDLTLQRREDLKLLKEHLLIFRQSGRYKRCFIQGNRIVLDDNRYSINEIPNIEQDLGSGVPEARGLVLEPVENTLEAANDKVRNSDASKLKFRKEEKVIGTRSRINSLKDKSK